ncbi:MAG: anaerobic glycerol-3-phosphate dehydrogenase subunit B, partial [Selenomonas sp.]|nr:anaerobic glycerol-3-phosphate dehydrogenase subunit B [Selenomonas sp.]
VIGSGLAGLMAALVSANQRQQVMLLTAGAGSLTLNSGVIDILGYDENHNYVECPREAIASLPQDHPYQKIGVANVEKAVEFFLDFTRDYGFPYHGSLDHQLLVPTAVGTLKPTCLAPRCLDGTSLHGEEQIIIVGIKGLKDFYGNILQENLRRSLDGRTEFPVVEVETPLQGGRDITTLDVARWLDTEDGRNSFVRQLKPYVKSDSTVFIVPQILGTRGQECAAALHELLGAELLETTCLPPSVNGLRLQKMLKQALKDLNVEIVENTKVLRAVSDGQRVKGVVAKASIREKTYYADKFILATGGLYSGGITVREFDKPQETVFDLPVYSEAGEENWSNEELFGDKAQGFAKTGVRTDNSLRPVDADNRLVYENVYVAGRNLGGYDFCFEHSGNGVALASAYKAAML